MTSIWIIEESGGAYDSYYTKTLRAYTTEASANKAKEAMDADVAYVYSRRHDGPARPNYRDYTKYNQIGKSVRELEIDREGLHAANAKYQSEIEVFLAEVASKIVAYPNPDALAKELEYIDGWDTPSFDVLEIELEE